MSPNSPPELARPDRAGSECVSMSSLPATRPPAVSRSARLRRFVVTVVVLALIWAVLTEARPDALIFGIPAVLVGATVSLMLPDSPRWRMSPRGAVVFAIWFAVQSVRGAVDVAGRAFAPQMPLRPGFRRHPLRFPPGAPRVMFVNTISLLPGTLSAEIAGEELVVHMLDTRADLAAELSVLEDRIAALFALHSLKGDR